jgi:hypothetical protein
VRRRVPGRARRAEVAVVAGAAAVCYKARLVLMDATSLTARRTYAGSHAAGGRWSSYRSWRFS